MELGSAISPKLSAPAAPASDHDGAAMQLVNLMATVSENDLVSVSSSSHGHQLS
jgi:hypothetical protein